MVHMLGNQASQLGGVFRQLANCPRPEGDLRIHLDVEPILEGQYEMRGIAGIDAQLGETHGNPDLAQRPFEHVELPLRRSAMSKLDGMVSRAKVSHDSLDCNLISALPLFRSLSRASFRGRSEH